MNALTKLEEIKTIPASISFDFESVKTLVVAHLERFANIVVTEDTVKEGKELIKEINTTRKALEDARKNEAKKASEPIKAFEANMKELVSLHDTLLDNLRVQIAKFEDEQKELIRAALKTLQASLWAAQSVRPEFQKSQVDHLVLLGSFTAGGKLTTKAQAEVKQLVANDFAVQVQTDLRLSQLESLCYKAGLAAPLNNGHVRHFIFDDEVTYQTKLNALMSSELEREKQAIEFRKAQELRAQHQAEAERERQEQAAEAERLRIEKQAKQQAQAEQQAEQKPQPQQGKQRVLVSLVFDLEIPAHITSEVIANQLDAKLKAAGFNNHTITEIKR